MEIDSDINERTTTKNSIKEPYRFTCSFFYRLNEKTLRKVGC